MVIDELVDTGNSMKKLRSMLPKPLFVTLYAKPQGIASVDYYLRKYQWLGFPWEKEEK